MVMYLINRLVFVLSNNADDCETQLITSMECISIVVLRLCEH